LLASSPSSCGTLAPSVLYTLSLHDALPISVTPGLPVIPATPPPTTDDVATQELNRIYAEVLGRNPDSSGLATYGPMLAAGTSVEDRQSTRLNSSHPVSSYDQLCCQEKSRDA